MAETKRRRGGTKISKIKPPELEELPTLHGIAENLYTLQQDLEVARKIQGRLLPPPPKVPGYDLEVYYQPAGEVGGDFYDFLPMDGGRMGLLVADPSGKGLAGAVLIVAAGGRGPAQAS